jgi:hypothetical protein
MKMSNKIEPRPYTALVVVDEDRYSGAYSHAGFTAWWGIPPNYIDAGDPTCAEFWSENPDVLCGKGSTAQEAFSDLAKKIDEKGWLFEPKFIDAPGTEYGKSVYMLHDSVEFVRWLGKY